MRRMLTLADHFDKLVETIQEHESVRPLKFSSVSMHRVKKGRWVWELGHDGDESHV